MFSSIKQVRRQLFNIPGAGVAIGTSEEEGTNDSTQKFFGVSHIVPRDPGLEN
jgi:hypothetical protein